MSSPKAQYPEDWSPLHIAVWDHDFAQVRSLANPNSVHQIDKQGWTPVHLACAAGNSELFADHQVRRRNYKSNALSTSAIPPHPSQFSPADDNERASAMRILGLLLVHYSSGDGHQLGIRESRFPTALFCAASSGWLGHAQALVENGASVYTGPVCSPICRVKGGSQGNNPVAIYLRAELGDHGLAMIKADHERGLPEDSDDTPPAGPDRPVKRVKLDVSKQETCLACRSITLIDLFSSRGYFHQASAVLLRQSAKSCRLCKLIDQMLSEGGLLDRHDTDQIMIRISNGNKRHVGGICTLPRIIRNLEIRLVARCTCPVAGSPFRSPRTFSNCRGSCEGIRGTEVAVTIYSAEEITLAVSIDFLGEPDSPVNASSWTIQKGIDIDQDPLSFKSLTVIRNWIASCMSDHPHCHKDHHLQLATSMIGANIPPPGRIIDVSSPDGQKMCLCQGLAKNVEYITLSHRWNSGPMPLWVTTLANVDSRRDWFSIDEFPASIVDAIQVTRILGLRYLWVDSLCIIQDSRSDWEVESARMAQIYANAYLTLFAHCGRDDDHGFIFSRKFYPSTSVALPTGYDSSIKLNIRKSSRSSFRSDQRSLFSTNVEASHLSDRGWIFQERLLSPRILHFGKDQMFWECKEGTFAEDGHVVLRNGQLECGQQETPFSKWSYASLLDETATVSPELFASQWESLVKAYSTLKLTREDDKLPALSGLAVAFQAHMKDNEYIAGVWRQNLPQHLAWSITNTQPESEHRSWRLNEGKDGSSNVHPETDKTFVHPSKLFARPATYRAPSFSWAAVEGEIEFHKISNPCANVISVSLDLPANTPYGRPRSGSMTITGPFRQALSYGPFKKDIGAFFCRRRAGYIPLYDQDWPFAYVLPDSKDDVEDRNVHCLKIGQTEYSTEDVFLVLVAVHDKNVVNSKKFRRIGLGVTREKGIGFFAEAGIQTIEIL